MIDLLFKTKESWAHDNKPPDALAQIVGQAGMSREQFETCLGDEKLLEGLRTARDRAANELGVSWTPTFFINGRKETGALTMDQFDKILEPLLAAHSQ
jgi:protein-disulfide isomerase